MATIHSSRVFPPTAKRSTVSGSGSRVVAPIGNKSTVPPSTTWHSHTTKSFLERSKKTPLVGIAYDHRQAGDSCPYSLFYANERTEEMNNNSSKLSEVFDKLKDCKIRKTDQGKYRSHGATVVNDANSATEASSGSAPVFALMDKHDFGTMVREGTVSVYPGSAGPPAWSPEISNGISQEDFYKGLSKRHDTERAAAQAAKKTAKVEDTLARVMKWQLNAASMSEPGGSEEMV